MVSILLEETAEGHLTARVRGDLKVIEALAAAYALLSGSAEVDSDPEIAGVRDHVLAIIRRGGAVATN